MKRNIKPIGENNNMKKQDLKNKFVIGYDTICDGNQCVMTEDDKGKSIPALYNSEAEAMIELFDDALSMIENKDDEELEECHITSEQRDEMRDISEEGNTDKMKEFLAKNPECNYNDEFIEPAEDFIMNRKAFFTGQGIVIEGTKLINI